MCVSSKVSPFYFMFSRFFASTGPFILEMVVKNFPQKIVFRKVENLSSNLTKKKESFFSRICTDIFVEILV